MTKLSDVNLIGLGDPPQEPVGVDYSGAELRALASKSYLGAEFWLQFPIEVRPLKFVPGRNRREKRTFRALAAKQERGTITRGRKGKGGELGKLQALYAELARAGAVRMTGEKK